MSSSKGQGALFTPKVQRVALVRHAHSEKNEEDRHGGPGRQLTELGRRQLISLSEFLKGDLGMRLPFIASSGKQQVHETATWLANSLSCNSVVDSRLEPLGLGVVAGLSRAEAAVQHPSVADRFERWRKGELTIEDLEIPEGESFEEFWERGLSFLREYLHESSSYEELVIVGTRSILILILNIMLRRTELKLARYSVFDFDNSGVTLLSHLGQSDGVVLFLNKLPPGCE